MSRQSAARKAWRTCKRQGHIAKTDGNGDWFCARCGVPLNDVGQP